MAMGIFLCWLMRPKPFVKAVGYPVDPRLQFER
jgi:hypothetical protein